MPDKVFAAIALFAVANGALINLIMASRLTYGMARQGHRARRARRGPPRSPSAGQRDLFTVLLCAILVAIGDLATLADTTVLLLLVVFVFVNVSVLVLRRDPVAYAHFRAPSILPVVGAGVCVALMTQKSAETFARAAALLAVGVLFWLVNRLVAGRPHERFETEELQAPERP